MVNTEVSAFEIVLLMVGLTAAVLGFLFINHVYLIEGEVSWLMVIAIFNWLILLVLLVSLSIAVDVSKKQLAKIEDLAYLLSQRKGKK